MLPTFSKLRRINPNLIFTLIAIGVLPLLIFSCPALCVAEETLQTSSAESGVHHILNPSTPPEKDLKLELDERWRVGGDSEDPGEFFGLIDSIAIDGGGNSYLLDRQLQEIKVFSPDGKHLRTFGRPGKGPGDLDKATSLFMMPVKQLGALQSNPTRVAIFDLQGVWQRDIHLSSTTEKGTAKFGEPLSRGGVLGLLCSNFLVADGVMDTVTRIITVDGEGRELGRFARATSRLEFADMKIVEQETNPFRWTIGPQGRIYINFGFDHMIEVRHPNGELVRTIERDFDHRRRNKIEMQQARDHYGTGKDMQGVELDISEYHRDINRLHVMDNGDLWVRTSRAMDLGNDQGLGRFDVYGPDGELRRSVELGAEFDAGQDRFIFAGDHLFVLKFHQDAKTAWIAGARPDFKSSEDLSESEGEPMSVICYRLPSEVLD